MTIRAGPFFGGTAVLQVMTGAIRVMEMDGTERQVIKDVESSSSSAVAAAAAGGGGGPGGGGEGGGGHLPRAKIRACSINDPYVLILREDDTMGLFIGYFADRDKVKGKDGKEKDSGGKARGKDSKDKDKDGKTATTGLSKSIWDNDRPVD
ncbi:hypothetical protein D9757_010764 [Collybiopsis confluens]|uniref:Uncharacterized protein n=1 Tax=Collybiopsis confluens TaxID=2823264 RepID=A0A8H5H933_9AGAR|nr:hypothetical protein D9757_010764 [Collybiopsis confluens]